METFFEALLALIRTGESAAMAIVIKTEGSSPRKAGAKMIVRQDGSIIGTMGGGDLEKRVIDEAVNTISQGGPRVVSFTLDLEQGGLDMRCGGTIDVYIEPVFPQEKLIIFGAGHISSALAPIMSKAGFQITVVDDNPDLISQERFPEVDDLKRCDMEGFAGDMLPAGPAYVVLLSGGYLKDKAILEKVIQKDLRYIGMIGSASKLRSMMEDLKKVGITEELFSRLSLPIGLDIGAETPQEIAISIAGEIIAARKGKLGRFKKGCASPGQEE